MTDALALEPRKLDIARVLEGAFKVLGRNIVTFGILALVLSGLPTAIVAFVQITALRGADGKIAVESFWSADYWSAASMGGLAGLICSAVLQGTLIYATIQDMNGQRPALADCLATGLRNFLPLIGVTILFALGVMLGFVLLIVPAIMIACAWSVAVPALVADRTGVFGAFSRAADLTRGNRWRIFALGGVIWIVLLVIGMIFNAITGVAVMSGDLATSLDRALSPLALGLAIIRGTITSVVGATIVAVLYVELRQLRDGGAPGWLADVFS